MKTIKLQKKNIENIRGTYYVTVQETYIFSKIFDNNEKC